MPISETTGISLTNEKNMSSIIDYLPAKNTLNNNWSWFHDDKQNKRNGKKRIKFN